MAHSNTSAIILSAGESRRMGSPKALLRLGDKTILERLVGLFQKSGVGEIIVVIGCSGDIIRSHHPDLPVHWVRNDQFQQGMFSSVLKGVAAVDSESSWFFLLPVDIPLVKIHTISALMEECLHPTDAISILHPTFMGKRGHPPLIAASLIPGILSWNSPGGLRNFLKQNDAVAREVPVIDAFIEKDMDTPADYQAIQNAFERRHIPTLTECSAILNNARYFSEETAAHCHKVATLAVHFGKTLSDCGVPIDLELIESAALLHDIGKGHPDHASAGAALLTRLGFSGIADIVAAHMDIELSPSLHPNECELVYLADKLVEKDTLVPLRIRFENKLIRHGKDPDNRAIILKRWANADAIAKCVEKTIGAPLKTFLTEYTSTSQ